MSSVNMTDAEAESVHVSVVHSQCQTCLHRINKGVTCQAFPNGIPLLIFAGLFDHTNPWIETDGTVGDRELRYLPPQLEDVLD